MNNVTLHDVAKEAGVSIATVSRVINDNYRGAADVAEKVLHAVEKIGYVQNSVARSLKMEVTYSIGFVVSDISNKYFMEMAKAIEDVVSVRGYNIIVCSTEGRAERELEYLKTLSRKKIDALIVNTTGFNDQFLAALSRFIPLLLLHRRLHGVDWAGDLIDTNNTLGGYLITRELLKHGHTRIGEISGLMRISTGFERHEGFLRALQEAAVPTDPAMQYEGDFSFRSGYNGAGRLLALKPPPTALVAMNNEMALGLLHYVSEVGIEVPGQLSVTAFGSIEHRNLMTIKPTVVVQDAWEMGRRAAGLVLERIADNSRESREVVLDVTLSPGNSVLRPVGE